MCYVAYIVDKKIYIDEKFNPKNYTFSLCCFPSWARKKTREQINKNNENIAKIYKNTTSNLLWVK